MKGARNKVRAGSMFYQFLFWILLLVLALISIFFIFLFRNTVRDYQQRLEQMDADTINRTIMTIDLSIENLTQRLDDLAVNDWIINAAIFPVANQYEQSARVLQQLKDEAENSLAIDDIYFIERTGNMVYTASGNLTEWEKFDRKETLETCFQHGYSVKYVNKRYDNYLAVDDREIYLYQHILYRIKEPMATIVLKLDETWMEYLLDDYRDGAVRLNVTDISGNSLYQSFSASEIPKQMECRSAHTDWLFQYGRLEEEALLLTDIIAVLWPTFLILVLMAGSCAFFVVNKMYQPIGHMVSIVSHRHSDIPTGQGNEIDYLKRIFDTIEHDSAQMKAVIDSVSGDVVERLMQRIIDGQQIEQNQISQILEDVSSPFTYEGKYMVLVCQLDEKRINRAVEQSIWFRVLEQFIKNDGTKKQEGMPLFFVRDPYGVIVLEFQEECSVVKAKEFANRYQQRIKMYIRQSGLECSIGSGKIYYHIWDIYYSYKEACENLQYQKYFLEEERNDIKDETEGMTDAEIKLKHISDAISAGEFTSASILLDRLIQEPCFVNQEPECAFVFYSGILDLLIEKVLEYKMSIGQVFSDSQQDVYEKLRESDNVDGMKNYMISVKTQILKQLQQQYERRQYQIVMKAKEYLEENYSDSNLSLNRTAEVIGVNAAYLSTLFNESMEMGITDYINMYRINQAVSLLEETNIKMKEVGYKTGFSTVQTFNRVFKKLKGCTPSQYREKVRNHD